jgi:DNA polymerase I-like protein with 3'-5' exonuclease and polymerase domains
MGLYDLISLMAGPEPETSTWTPQPLPSLDGVTDIEFDCETTGLRWWDGDKPIGFAIGRPGGVTQYIPFGHRGGGNHDENTVRRWAHRELRNKRITNLNTRFDIHIMREWGVDLEEQGCEFSDVAHYAALLDDHRGTIGPGGLQGSFSLESIVNDYLPDEQKVRYVGGRQLDARRMADYHASVIAVRAEADVRQVQKLKHAMWPQLTAQDLHRVRTLEDSVIPVVCEMEKNGTIIDVTLLERWTQELRELISRLSMEIFRESGVRVNAKNNDDMIRLFEKLKLPISHTAKGSPSFAAPVLKAIKHPIIQKVALRNKLVDLMSKYFIPYAKRVRNIQVLPDGRKIGILRYALHQLRAQKDPNDPDDMSGTISGRFSSTQLEKDVEGLNIQQIMKPSKQRVMMGYDEDDDSHDLEIFIVRQLHICAPGQLFVSSDAMQIEYRFFADYTRSPRLLKVYEEDPMASFHKKTHAMFKPFKPDLTYRRQKDVNFAYIYAAGVRKMALMLEYITPQQFAQLNRDKNWKSSPLLKDVFEIKRIYGREIPEADELVAAAMHIAMPECNDRCNKNAKSRKMHARFQHRGYVMSILGRRSRFPDGQRVHKALNCVIQPSAADVNKQKGVELYRERKRLGLTIRYTVHDEWNMDAPSMESAYGVKEILNRQSFDTKVPILWETSVGPNWKDGVTI